MVLRDGRTQPASDPTDHLRLVAEYSTDVLFHVDLAGVLEWASPSVERMLGWTPSALLGRSMRELLVHDDRSLVGPIVERLRAGSGSTFDARMATECGGARWVSVSIAPILGDDGTLVGGVGSVRDIDADMTRLVAQRLADERVRAALDSLHDPHVVLEPVRDADGEIVDFVHVHANDAACADSGRSRAELLGARLLEVVPGEMGSALLALYRRVMETGEPLVLDDFVAIDQLHAGVERRFDVRAAKVGDALSHTWRDVTDRHRALAELLDRATHDALTGLANRSTVSDELDRALAAARAQGHSLAVLLVDVDHFKQVNDTFGHAAGDDLLRIAAGRLCVCTRHGDLVARLGGDEFLIVMPKVDDEWEASSAADRLMTHFRTPVELCGRRLRLSLSVGIALVTGAEPADEVLRRADLALYEAKDAGRDRAVVYDPGRDRSVRSVAIGDEVALGRHELESLLGRHELVLHYLPEIDLATGAVVGVEALVRWHHPSGTIFPAGRLVELAARHDDVLALGRWSIGEACRFAAAHPRLRVRINVLAPQLEDASFVDQVVNAADAAGSDLASLVVEVPESSVLVRSEVARCTLDGLRARGVRVAVDRFGAEVGSLALLSSGEVDSVKLAGGLLDVRGGALVAGIVSLASACGVGVTASEVETTAQAEIAAASGCASAQGYLYSRPLAPGECERFLREHAQRSGTASENV